MGQPPVAAAPVHVSVLLPVMGKAEVAIAKLDTSALVRR
jgi:hypothetical protein